MSPTAAPRIAVPLIAGVGTLAVLAYAMLAAVQILVLNPLAAAPGATLDQISQDLADAGEHISTGFVIGFLALGPALAIVVLLLVARRADATVPAVASAYLLLLVLGTPAYFVASFGPGMALADTYWISGADQSPWAIPLYITSLLAIAGLLGLVMASVMRRHRAESAEDPVPTSTP